MRVFTNIYDWMIKVSARPQARIWLAVVSFLESSFFIVPPDVMLLPMSVAQPARWLQLAVITTVSSVVGGLLGYAIGFWLVDLAMPMIKDWGYEPAYQTAWVWFKDYGVWAVLIAGFTPVPYKIFTIASGGFGLFLPGFVVMSLLGRGLRFFLVAFLAARYGPDLVGRLYGHLEVLGWSLLVLLVVYGSYLLL